MRFGDADAAWGDDDADRANDQVKPGLRTYAGKQTAELFQEFHAGMLRYTVSITHHPAEAEDLVQEAFLRLFRELQAGVSIRDPRAWLYSVVHRLAIDYHRHPQHNEAPDFEVVDRRANPEAAAIETERGQWLANAVASLSPQQRQCLSLRAEGLRYREIASILGVQISTVRTMIVRAVSRLAGGPR